MLKNVDKYENNNFSYEDYKKKTNKSSNKYLVVFTSVFVIGVLLFLGMEKILSPNVDVGLGEEDSWQDEGDETQPSAIDDRLKRIQMEDSGKNPGDEDMFTPELDVKVVLPNSIKKTTGQMAAEEQEQHITPDTTVKPQTTNKQIKEQEPVQNQPDSNSAPKPAAQIVNAKVVVGYYATEKQAEVAKSIIHDAGLGVTPIVKNLGGYYTLQVGSYSSREKAQQAANNLLRSNFPARVIVE